MQQDAALVRDFVDAVKAFNSLAEQAAAFGGVSVAKKAKITSRLKVHGDKILRKHQEAIPMTEIGSADFNWPYYDNVAALRLVMHEIVERRANRVAPKPFLTRLDTVMNKNEFDLTPAYLTAKVAQQYSSAIMNYMRGEALFYVPRRNMEKISTPGIGGGIDPQQMPEWITSVQHGLGHNPGIFKQHEAGAISQFSGVLDNLKESCEKLLQLRNQMHVELGVEPLAYHGPRSAFAQGLQLI